MHFSHFTFTCTQGYRVAVGSDVALGGAIDELGDRETTYEPVQEGESFGVFEGMCDLEHDGDGPFPLLTSVEGSRLIVEVGIGESELFGDTVGVLLGAEEVELVVEVDDEWDEQVGERKEDLLGASVFDFENLGIGVGMGVLVGIGVLMLDELTEDVGDFAGLDE